jgi:peroxiredoxin
MSVDSVYSHKAFAEELGGLPFELIGDFERKVVDSWGVRRTDLEGYDGVPRRSIFILDPDRVVGWRWVTTPEQRLPDVAEVLSQAMAIAARAGGKPAKKTAARKTAVRKTAVRKTAPRKATGTDR